MNELEKARYEGRKEVLDALWKMSTLGATPLSNGDVAYSISLDALIELKESFLK